MIGPESEIAIPSGGLGIGYLVVEPAVCVHVAKINSNWFADAVGRHDWTYERWTSQIYSFQ